MGLRLLSEAGFGLLAGSLGMASGALVGGIAGCITIVACILGIVGGAELGFAIGVVVGVHGGGEAAGGDGKLLAVSLGTVAGVVGSIVLLTSNILPSEFVPIVLALVAPPLMGAMVGYELSVSPEPEAPAVALGHTRIRPLLSVSPRGAFVGLGGRF
jgi:hypothetical protein